MECSEEGMKKWFYRLNIVEAFLVGIYLSIIPSCYVLVEMQEHGFNEFILMYSFFCMFAGPSFLLALLNRLNAYRWSDKNEF